MLKTSYLNNPDVVLIDFGVSKALVNGDSFPCGTPGYIPPETFRTGKWFPKGDIFSLGVCIVQLLTDNVPDFDRPLVTPEERKGIFMSGCRDINDAKIATFKREPPYYLLQQYCGLESLARAMLDKTPTNRLRAPQALSHQWFTGTANASMPMQFGAPLTAQSLQPLNTNGVSSVNYSPALPPKTSATHSIGYPANVPSAAKYCS